jgi:hypothetical protein
MDTKASVRGLAVLLLLGGGVARAQSTLPATGPTVLPAAGPQRNAAPAPEPAGRARVVWLDGQLEVTADNSSLNQILREIGRETGMKITGGVTDERVFGEYGPGAPAEILMRLLDGTGSNVLLRETASKVPAELILTVREGGPTPPNPNARGMDDDAPSDEVQTPPPPPMPPAPVPRAQPMVSAPVGADANVGAAGANPATADGGTAPGAGDPTSPNGVRSPQQIFEQLQQLQRAQPQQPGNPK